MFKDDLINSNKVHDENCNEKQTNFENVVQNNRLVKTANSTIPNGIQSIVNDRNMLDLNIAEIISENTNVPILDDFPLRALLRSCNFFKLKKLFYLI